MDVDGTVVEGETALPAARDAVAALLDRGIRVVFCSNNPTKRPAAYAGKLERAGIPLPEEEPSGFVVTAGTATAAYLTDHHPDEPTYVFGESGLRDLLADAEVRLTDDPEAASVVVASVDYEFDYESMRTAIRAVDEETAFVGTDPDPVIPTGDGPAPGSGAIVTAVAGVVGREPEAIPGKPAPTARDLVTDRLGVPPAATLVVGDRLDTDVALGEAAGAHTALVTTGVTDRAAVADSPHDPDHVIDSLAELDDVFGDHLPASDD